MEHKEVKMTMIEEIVEQFSSRAIRTFDIDIHGYRQAVEGLKHAEDNAEVVGYDRVGYWKAQVASWAQYFHDDVRQLALDMMLKLVETLEDASL